MQKSRVRQAGALLVGLALVAASCGDDKKSEDTGAPTSVVDTTPETTPATDPPAAGGELAGMKGTTPLPPEMTQEFKDQLSATPTGSADGGLTDFNYGSETYDAVIIIALAVEAAQSDGIEYASFIVGQSIVIDGG